MSFTEIDLRQRDYEWSMSELQSHEHFEIYCLTSGERKYFFDDRIYNISAPTVCVIPPFTLHKTEGGAFRRITLNVSSDVLTDGELEHLYELGKHGVFKLDPDKASLFLSMLDESVILSYDQPGEDPIAPHFIHVLLSLLRHAEPIPYDVSEERTRTKKEPPAMRAVSYINKHYSENFTLDELCERIFVSKNTLCADFRSIMHCSVMEYRTFIRISKAKELLSSTKMGLERIASECGFSSANYFGLIFKKTVGISPTNYRKVK
ncbi:MAG: helix-turn-helix domain-containing protein [Clostridia bacterium]|nr:helix-turn-helix domain-containing protein [Clostridia bacterium]